MRTVVVVLVLCSVACAAPLARPLSRAPVDPIVSEPLPPGERFAPTTPPAMSYNEVIEPGVPSALDAAVLATLQRFSVAARPMLLDERLSRASADLAEVTPPDGLLSDALIDFAIQRHGVIDPLSRLFVVWSDPTAMDQVAVLLASKLSEEVFYAPAVRVGIGVGPLRDGVAPIVVIVVRTSFATAPIPRQVDTGSTVALDATMNERLRDPVVTVVREDGSRERPQLALTGAGRFGATIACGPTPGRLSIDITATHPTGPTTLAIFPLWCGARPSAEYRWEHAQIEDGATTAELVERRLLALINRDRTAAGLPPLRVDRELAAAARDHLRKQRIGPVALDVAIPGAVGGSTAARVAGIRTAYEGFANHRGPHQHMLARASTHIGAAVARGDDGGLDITLLYRRVPPDLDVDATARDVTARIKKWTGEESYPQLVKIAHLLADELVAGISQKEAWEDMRWWLDDIRYRFKRFTYTLTRTPDLELVRPHWLLGPGAVHAFGVAVRQRDHVTYGRNAIWIVVVMGERKDR